MMMMMTKTGNKIQMEFIKRYLGIEQLQLQRKQQLAHQAHFDDAFFQPALKECPYFVAAYLLHERKENRRMTKEYEDEPLSAYTAIAQAQLRKIDSQQKDLVDAALRPGPHSLCHYLARFNK